VYYKTLLGRDKVGVFTEYIKEMNNIKLYNPLKLSFREGSFPKINTNDNIILICTGTGYAPIRNFLWKCIEGQHKGTILLFYGCRNKTKDFLYSSEHEIFKQNLK
jgi:sulfite reductase alpha subunit-like flavoprotein